LPLTDLIERRPRQHAPVSAFKALTNAQANRAGRAAAASECTGTAAAFDRCYKLANDGQDTRSIAHYLGHRNLQSTARYTALAL
jgi:hypothetical protein